MSTKTKLDAQRVWRGRYRDVGFKIVSWPFRGLEDRFPSGAWNYYVYIQESACADFTAIWLKDKKVRFSEKAPFHITHDYYNSPVGDVEMHGGITYYAKHGHTEGHRCVEIGCDYQHLWDDGKSYDEEDVLRDVEHTIDHLYERGLLRTTQ